MSLVTRLLVALAVLWLPFSAAAQETRSMIHGHVYDPQRRPSQA